MARIFMILGWIMWALAIVSCPVTHNPNIALFLILSGIGMFFISLVIHTVQTNKTKKQ